MKLFEIAQEYQEIINELYDEDDNENPQAIARLEANTMALEKKSLSISSWIRNMEIEKETLCEAKRQIDQAKKNILARERALENKIDRWKGYILNNMEARGIKEIKCPYFVIKLRKNNPSVDDYAQDQIPDEYWIIERKLNKLKMLSDMKVGVIIPGAELKQNMRLDIR